MEGFTKILEAIDGVVWGLPLIILIMGTGIFLTIRLRVLQFRKLGKAFKYMVKNEEDGIGEVTSFGALCTAMAATIGTGNIVGVATAVLTGGPGALFWMIVAACLGMATKFSEGVLAVQRGQRQRKVPGRTVQVHRAGHGRKMEVARQAVCNIRSGCGTSRYRYHNAGKRYSIGCKDVLRPEH